MLQQARVRTRKGLVAGLMNRARSFGSLKWETGNKAFASALLLPISGKLSEIESSDQGSKVKQVKQTLVQREF